jgi:hypothetical protein
MRVVGGQGYGFEVGVDASGGRLGDHVRLAEVLGQAAMVLGLRHSAA